MLQKQIHGRLGNQMFQYAAIKGIMKKNGLQDDIGLYFKRAYKDNFENDLKNFKIKGQIEISEIKLNIIQKICVILIKSLKKIGGYVIKDKDKYARLENRIEIRLAPIFSKMGVYNLTQGYYDFKLNNSKNKIFMGLFETQKYFDNIRNELLEEFTPKQEPIEKNLNLYRMIESSESVCVTIRRGDFLSDKYSKEHYVCTPQYFTKSIELMQERIKECRFFVFSDDIQWVKENMNFPKDTVFESGNDPVWEKLRLMYSCKHFIISNSTFSWWAQYLSRNENKTVIAPKIWKNIGFINTDIYDENWITMEV